MEAINEIFAAYGTYINIAIGAAVFILFTVFRNKLASLLLGITGKIIFAKYPQRRQGYKNSIMHPVAIYFIVLGLFLGIIINYNHTIIRDTFKIVSVTSAVDSGKATFDTMINCTPYPVPGSRPVTDAPRSYGGLTVAGVLKKSSNPGAFRIALKSGWPTYKKYFDLYGFSSKTGIDLPGETNSQCQDGSNFVNFSRISFGYSLMVSPLQVAMAYAAIANDGVRMRPRLVDGIYVDDRNFQPSPPVEVCRVMSVKTARDLRNALFHVTDLDGTAKRARIEGYNVGGKTGTAHKVKPTGGYFENRYTVSFVGMLPVEDPAFVCLVVIDDPTSKHCHPGGGSVCAPVFQKLATRLAAAMNIPKNSPSAEANKKASRAQASSTPSKPPRR